jgi:predicted ATPase
MTFLFTDIEGSTRHWEESPEMSERVAQHFAVLRAAVDGGGGRVFATAGDGVAAAFTSVEGALRAAIAAQRAMAATGLAVRMGIHTGEVEPVDDDFRGRAVNRAARIMAVGHGGQILLSDVSAALVRTGTGRVTLTDLGTHRLRDLTEPERLWQVDHPDLGQRFPPVRGVDSYFNNLPAQRSSLVGRDQVVQRLVDLAQRHRIVTLTGVGGVGKTRLAIHAAADLLSEFATVWFVELARVRDPGDVAETIARTVGGAGAVGAPDPLATATAALTGGRRLLVLDNCEHVVAGAAAAIDVLTATCPELSVVATSREVLGVDGEHILAVRSLDPSTAAGELFRQRAVAAGVDVATLDPEAVAELCRRLDGLPLAIELAAARAATLGVAAILGGLADGLDLGAGGRRRDGRHSTMRTTIEWSYRLLDTDEQQLFRWLAVFPNGFELDAVRHVAFLLGIDDLTATEHMASLVHKSMLTADASSAGVRYRMLETMRAFAAERLDELDERLPAQAALADWVATITDLPYTDPCTAAVERHVLRLEREGDAWREAVATAARLGSGELAAALCGPPVAFFLLGRHDLADDVRPLLALCADGAQRRAVLTALIVSASGGTEPAQMRAWADEVAALDAADPTGLGGLMGWFTAAWSGDFPTAIDVCVAASRDSRLGQSTRDLFVGIAVLDQFSLTDATADTHGLFPRALEVADRSDVALHRATCLLGAAWGLAGTDPDHALQLVRRAINEVPNVPALTRLTLPGSAARLLSRLDPSVAARGLLEQLDATPSRRSFIDLIPLFYAASLLDGLGGGRASDSLMSVTAAPAAPRQSMMDFVDLARRAAMTPDRRWLSELETTVRAELGAIAGVHAAEMCA